MALSELWLSQILACVFIRCCIWPSRTLSRNKLNGTIPVSLTGLLNLINLLFDSNNLNGQILQTLFQIPKYNFTGNNLNCGVGQPHPCVSEVARSGIDIKDTNVTCSWMLQVGSWMLQLYHLKLVWSVLCCGLFELYIVVLLRTSTSAPE
ncbi:probable LRR receptor-like serine/threonine-protein kinase At5g63710 isoform X1 [Brassica rapa]|uniref:probable LRR receptor-like serine/threonine-protein kinase At5g63710 isoform X1 n=1 Tax=Brassica campestris TaxID=3711 RepID=UPI00142D6F9A|nr:probable LRR receptor-like serine/threonine-protein kinase At5g63710 isoform X1 [Brassica rapa]XP_048616306.1 probable LRR receptor-like serine/threonine-protein kinase At5g63710 isoform X2 [Brassica napus]XP_048628973.1 probable LRR receptor-like serine/threonine-protein kinase At5g63710 isoform X2 [Brassica napus]